MIRFARTIWFLALGLAFVFSNEAAACPTCKDSLHDNGAATGYAISILFMMSMPLLITAFWAILIWRLRTKMLAEQAEMDLVSNWEENSMLESVEPKRV